MFALLGGQAASLIGAALRTRPRPTTKPTPKVNARPNHWRDEAECGKRLRLDAAKHSVKAWRDQSSISGGKCETATRSNRKRYAGRMAKDMKGSELQALLAEILGQGAVIQRTSGYIVQGDALKAQQATPHVATC